VKKGLTRTLGVDKVRARRNCGWAKILFEQKEYPKDEKKCGRRAAKAVNCGKR